MKVLGSRLRVVWSALSKPAFTILVVLMTILLIATVVLAHKNLTDTAISISPNPVVAGSAVTITGTVTFTGGTGSGSAAGHGTVPTNGTPVVGDALHIQELMLSGSGVPCGTVGAGWVGIASGTTDADGKFAYSGFDTTGLGGQSICFRAQHPDSGGAHGNAESASDGLDMIISAAEVCTGFNIAADLADGSGTPAPGDVGPWQFRIRVKNCTGVNLTGIKVQGGSNGWAPVQQPFANNILVSTGEYVVRENRRNQVITWTLNLANNAEATLVATVDGVIPAGDPCGTVKNLNGAWSAVFDPGSGSQKSDYTGRVTIEVTCP